MTRLIDSLNLPLLRMVDSPTDLKQLTRAQLPQLAAEMRDYLLATLDETGGHFGANLGVVELTIALHYVFDSPGDAIVWDTGHQAYPHKILTGRRDEFATLRMLDGLSGFLRRDESEHDIIGAGHASTALPAALGIAAARSSAAPRWTIPVVGAGAMTGGLSLAGLNNASLATGKLLVILNDNGMSIAPNVGTISRYLSTIKARPNAQKLNKALRGMAGSLPLLRTHGRNFYDRAKNAFQYMWMPESSGAVFDLLGFHYYGPFDGHNVVGLANLLRKIRSWDASLSHGPLLLHVITEKGHGFAPAVADPYKWHAAKPRSITSEKQLLSCSPLPSRDEIAAKVEGKTAKPSSAKTYTQIFAEALIEKMREHPEAVAITAAMPDGTGLDKVAEAFPDRVIDVGITEEFAVTFACGLAIAGKRPICAIYSTFLQRAVDQIIHDAAINGLPVIFALDRGGVVGADGETHQGVFDLTYLRMIPGLVLMAPRDENELRHMVATAFAYKDGPIAFRFPRGNAAGVKLDDRMTPIPIGSWEVVRQPESQAASPAGRGVLILAVGHQVAEALAAADDLAKQGTECSVVNCRFVKPLDEALLHKLVGQAPVPVRIVTAEENVLAGGFGAGILEWLSDNHIPARVERVGIADEFVKHGSQEQQRARYGLDAQAIIAAVERTGESVKTRLSLAG
ncbi:MAG: 1-deoxy-D-xylulose-5-phosphate synthase [bacterium]|nr:1-deoxy-D-xylulose-5-phosphate synthase [bacterium]